MEKDTGETDENRDIIIEYNHKDKTDTDKGWAWLALFACFMSMVFVGSMLSGVGLLHIYLLEAFQEDDATTAWVGSLCTGLLSSLGPVASWISNRWSCRVCIFLGGVLAAGSLAAGSQVSSLEMTFLTIGLLSGSGFGLVVTPSFAVVGYYFDQHRSFASGIFVVGVNFGIMAGPPFIAFLEEYYGWRGAILIYSGTLLNFCVFASICKPCSAEQRSTRHRFTETRQAETSTRLDFLKLSCSREGLFGLFFHKSFVVLVVAVFLSNFSISVIYLHLPTYSKSQGASLLDIQMTFLAMGLVGMASKLLTGLAAGRVKFGETLERSCLLLGGCSLAATSLFILPSVSHSHTGRLICFLLVAFYYNVEPALYVVLTVDIVGLENLARAVGFEMFGIGIGFLIGPPFASWARQLLGDYKYSFYLAATGYLLSAFCCLLMMGSSKTKASINSNPIPKDITMTTGDSNETAELQKIIVKPVT